MYHCLYVCIALVCWCQFQPPGPSERSRDIEETYRSSGDVGARGGWGDGGERPYRRGRIPSHALVIIISVDLSHSLCPLSPWRSDALSAVRGGEGGVVGVREMRERKRSERKRAERDSERGGRVSGWSGMKRERQG